MTTRKVVNLRQNKPFLPFVFFSNERLIPHFAVRAERNSSLESLVFFMGLLQAHKELSCENQARKRHISNTTGMDKMHCGRFCIFSSARQTDSAVSNLSLNIHGHVEVQKSQKNN